MCVELVTLTFIEKRCMKKKYTKRKKIQKIIPPEEKKKSTKKVSETRCKNVVHICTSFYHGLQQRLQK